MAFETRLTPALSRRDQRIVALGSSLLTFANLLSCPCFFLLTLAATTQAEPAARSARADQAQSDA
jgi:hypothetical protein